MKPDIEKYKKEAINRGLIYIGESKDKTSSRKYRYKFKNCSHYIEAMPSNLRRSKSKLKCKECLVEKYKKEALERGLIYISSTNDGTFNLYKVKRCGKTIKIQPANIRRTKKEYNCNCNKCIELKINEAKKNKTRYRITNLKVKNKKQKEQEQLLIKKYQSEAAEKGLIYIGKSKNKSKSYRRYKFINCGHEADIQTPVVRYANPYCHICKEEEFKSDALKVGLELIGKSSRHQRKYKFISCGHIQSIGIKEVRTNSFICNQCEETSRDKPSKIYLLEMKYKKNQWLKLGYAKVIENRVRNYGILPGTKYKTLYEIDFKTAREANKLEKIIHKNNIKNKISKKNMKVFLTKNGYDECYPLKMKQALLKELANLGNK